VVLEKKWSKIISQRILEFFYQKFKMEFHKWGVLCRVWVCELFCEGWVVAFFANKWLCYELGIGNLAVEVICFVVHCCFSVCVLWGAFTLLFVLMWRFV